MFQENRGLLDKNRTEGYLIEKRNFMDFRELSYVLAIAKTQNITKAADSLYVTQPTLTKFLQNLEKEMGQKLFRKLGNRFVLTYAGERYVAKATEILNLKLILGQILIRPYKTKSLHIPYCTVKSGDLPDILRCFV